MSSYGEERGRRSSPPTVARVRPSLRSWCSPNDSLWDGLQSLPAEQSDKLLEPFESRKVAYLTSTFSFSQHELPANVPIYLGPIFFFNSVRVRLRYINILILKYLPDRLS